MMDQPVNGNADPGTARRGGSLAHRLLASAVFLPCLIVIARSGGWYYLALIDFIIIIGLWEYFSMASAKGMSLCRWPGMVCGALLPLAFYWRLGVYVPVLITAFLLVVMTAELLRGDTDSALVRMAVTVFGVAYVSWLGSYLVLVRELPRTAGLEYRAGFPLVIAVFTLTWCYDTGAYAAGRIFGRRKLFPSISPGKTLEGALGGLMLSVFGIMVARAVVDIPLSLWQAVLLAVVTSVVGQVGDLVESLIKRDAGVKDSSRAIPGHGGVLDRFDSLLFTAPVLYYLFSHLMRGGW